MFDFEKLDVYKMSIEWIGMADEMASQLPRGRSYLAEQLQRAATSIVLNIAEGAGEYSPGEKARFYRMARRSATECAAILDVCRQIHVIEDDRHTAGRELLMRIVSMLVKMVRRTGDPGTGTGRGTGTT